MGCHLPRPRLQLFRSKPGHPHVNVPAESASFRAPHMYYTASDAGLVREEVRKQPVASGQQRGKEDETASSVLQPAAEGEVLGVVFFGKRGDANFAQFAAGVDETPAGKVDAHVGKITGIAVVAEEHKVAGLKLPA